MKKLILLRHGKAQPDAPHGDHARHLTERGRREASEAGRKLPQMAGTIDGVVSSDASRALETAEIAVAAAGYGGQIRQEPAIYAADLDTLLGIVRGLPAEEDCVLLVGHNPGFEELAAALSEENASMSQLPTGAVVLLHLGVDSWEGVGRKT